MSNRLTSHNKQRPHLGVGEPMAIMQRELPESYWLVESPNPQHLYGNRLHNIFNCTVTVSAVRREIYTDPTTIHFSLPTDCNWFCNVEGFVLHGVKDGAVICSMSVEQLERLEDTDAMQTASGM